MTIARLLIGILATTAVFDVSAPSLRGQITPGLGTFLGSTAETRFARIGDVRYAFRAFGPDSGVPLVLINGFRATMNSWDPLLLHIIASERRVIVFDNVGMAQSTGATPTTLAGFAAGAATFIDALGYRKVDVLGFSFGGYVSQRLVLNRPELVRRLILASTGSGNIDNAETPDSAWKVIRKPINDTNDFLYLFFKNTETSRAAGRWVLARLDDREGESIDLKPAAVEAQIAASRDINTPATSLLNEFGRLTLPVLVASGSDDCLIPAHNSYVMFRALPDAKLVVYPDSGHGFLFQYAEEFGREVLAFLRDGSARSGENR